MKNKKGRKNNKNQKILVYSLIVVLCFIVVFSFGSNILRLLSSVYNVEDVSTKIDEIKIGDKINYSANGYDDWEVLNIDKDKNTIDIVSSGSVENVLLKGYQGWADATDTFNTIAQKYMDDKYAISARTVKLYDISNLNTSNEECFWIDDSFINRQKGNTGVAIDYSQYYFCKADMNVYYVPLVSGGNHENTGIRIIITLDIDENAYDYSVGDDYEYASNGITNWKVLSINSSNSISIITTDLQLIDLATNDAGADINSYLNNYLLNYYDNNNVTSVRVPNINDSSNLIQAGTTSGSMFTGVVNYIENNQSYSRYTENITYYRNQYIFYNQSSNQYYSSVYSASVREVEMGIRPIITIKFSDELVNDDSNKLTTDIKIGDYVKYEANSYTSWKVLSIDYDEGTAEIVSDGIVKLLSLNGLDDYENYETIVQQEVDGYLSGDSAISARLLDSSDIESLLAIKDQVESRYWLNNKREFYKQNDVGLTYNDLNYGVAIASYDESSLYMLREWIVLENIMENPNASFTSRASGSYSYTAGIRPVVKVKLENIIKDNEENTDNNQENNNISTEEENNQTPIKDGDTIIKNENNNQIDNTNDNQNDGNDATNNVDDAQNNNKENEDNKCIVYDESDNLSSEDQKNNCKISNCVKNSDLIWIIICSMLIGSAVSGVIMYELTKRKLKK